MSWNVLSSLRLIAGEALFHWLLRPAHKGVVSCEYAFSG